MAEFVDLTLDKHGDILLAPVESRKTEQPFMMII